MEVAAAASASAVDFHALSRRELQALCKRNGVRANMTNAAMADALQGLDSVDGVDEIGTTLCLPTTTPGRSTMKSAAKAAAIAGEEQQHGSPLPRGRRVSVMSPAAIRMDVMEGDDDLKQDVIKQIVKTPGVALRSTSRRAQATPAPLPTPATLRRSTRTAARKAAVALGAENLVEEEKADTTVKRTTRRASTRNQMMADLDQEAEKAAATPKVQEEEPKDVASDVKCDDPEEEDDEVTKQLGGDTKEEEPEEGEEADSSDTIIGSALISDKNNDGLKLEEAVSEMELETSKPLEGTVLEQEKISAENSTLMEPMEDSPILGILSKAESKESVVEKTQDASDKNDEGVAEWSPLDEMTYESSSLAVEDKAVAVAVGEEVIKEDSITVTGEALRLAEDILPSSETADEEEVDAGATEDETTEDKLYEDGSTENKLNEENDETNEEGGCYEVMTEFTEEKEVDAEAPEDVTTEEDKLDEDEEWSSDDDETSEEIDSSDENNEENDETNEKGGCTEVMTDFNEELVQMMHEIAVTQVASEDSVEEGSEDDSAEEKASEDGSPEKVSEGGLVEEDDFTSDLPPEFDNIVVFSAVETKSDNTPSVLENNQVAASSATKTAVKSLDNSAISLSNEEELLEEKDVSEQAMKVVGNTVDTIVKSLNEFTVKEATHHIAEENIGAEAVGSKGMQFEDYSTLSKRKLTSILKNRLAAKEDKKKHTEAMRQPLEEVKDNTYF